MIIWINGAFGIGKSTVAKEVHKILGKNKSLIYEPDEDFIPFLKNQSNIIHSGGTLPQNNINFIIQIRQKIYKLVSKETQRILIIPMSITEEICKVELLDYLEKNNIQIKHIILTAEKNTIKNRIQEDSINRDKTLANVFLESNIKFIENTFHKIEKINTEEKTIKEIATEIIDLL